ncbi:MAG: GDP-L-fucose synthase [bacterium]|nr:GDP-L-fucose synthase [bacterium]
MVPKAEKYKDARIVMTGASGFVGRNLQEAMAVAGYTQVVPLSSRDYNLLEQSEVRRMMGELKPDVVIHLAALSAGIKANKERPAEFFYRNLMMTTMVMHEAYLAGVQKLMTCIGGCSYPAHAPSPIKEESMWDGYPQPESAPYSIAKKMAIVQAEAYRRQYGFNAIVLVPGNLYGPYDNYNLNDAHVIPALIRKVYEAERRGGKQIIAWGTGAPVRDFIYSRDAAKALIIALEKYDSSEIINISSGVQTTIKELYTLVVELCGFKGEIVWDTSKPDGQMYKGFDVTRMRRVLGFHEITPLRQGLEETIAWFRANYDIPGAVRL